MKLVNAVTWANVAGYRATGGRLFNSINGAPVLLLDHVGRKSGRRRTTPLLYLRDRDDFVIVASSGGSKATPAWWFNLRASPRTTVRVGPDDLDVVAREATADERERLWPLLDAMYGDYAVYRARADREIPIAILSPA
jgi:deazaflavin-dependent oxidoreductase (nitroreductase family)